MKLALVTRRYPPECCGVGDYTARLAETWARQGHEVVVFVASGEKEGGRKSEVGSRKETKNQKSEIRSQKKPDEETAAGEIRIERIKLEGWRDVRRAVEAIREARPDVVQLEYSSYGWSRLGCAFWMNGFVRKLRESGGGEPALPVRIALHEFPLTFGQAPLLAGVSLLQRLHFALLARDASEVLTNTRERVRILRRWFPRRKEEIRYRPNSSHISVRAASAEQIASLRAEHAAAGALVVIMFGMFQSTKRYEVAIEAVGKLRGERPLALWLLGDTQQALGKYVEKLRAAVRAGGLEDDVWWPGRMTEDEISICLQAADVFLLPQPDGHLTRSSTFMAAAAHGLAAVAVRNTENQAEFAHGENVWLLDQGGADALAAGLRTLAGDVELRRRLGRNLRALYERAFAWEVTSGQKRLNVEKLEGLKVDALGVRE